MVDPERTLAIVCGAEEWPGLANFEAAKAFANSAELIRGYLTGEAGLGLTADRILWLFGEPGATAHYIRIGTFLQRQFEALGALRGNGVLVLFFYVGHGAFFGPARDYCLLLKDTQSPPLEEDTSLRVTTLARLFRDRARDSSRILFLDCCFAAGAARSFQGNLDQAVSAKAREALEKVPNDRGVALFCASSARDTARIESPDSYTLFSRELIRALNEGDPHVPGPLTLRQLCQMVQDKLQEVGGDSGPRPEVHVPDQTGRDLAAAPLFPNPALTQGQRPMDLSGAGLHAAARTRLDRSGIALVPAKSRADGASSPASEEPGSSEPEGWIFDETGLPSGRLYQPMLFVGLGGTGCQVGVELERQMRNAICGPDGNDFRMKTGKGGMLAYQLPSCVQFIYADLNQTELKRVPGRVAPGPEYIPAVPLTAQYVTGLVPNVASYPELAMRLRLRADQVVEGWLPPQSRDEPEVNPLSRGTGQFPTIGRAALFGTFLDGNAPAIREIEGAVGRLARSGADLHAMGGRGLWGVEVFVAFSVTGGTGAGIFYDYLHLIAHTVERNGLRLQIYPLVLMPSAFTEGSGGGREAELNAGRALLDLFRLVDHQNRPAALPALQPFSDRPGADKDDVAVMYPGNQRLVMSPGRMRTGFLFSRPAGAAREDMYRSMASLVMTMVGTEMSEDDRQLGDQPMSFAESFVSDAPDRAAAAEDGIGARGLSTVTVASLTVPVDELSRIVGARLLREAIVEMSVPDGRVESNRDEIKEFLIKTGVYPAVQQQVGAHAEPEPGQGARNVMAVLDDRRESMRLGIDSLRAQLDRDVPELASRFDPRHAVTELLGRLDPFRVRRVVFGHQRLGDAVEQDGASGVLRRKRSAPAAPPGLSVAPPATPEFRDRLARRVRWNDEDVVAARNQQNLWYEWRTRATWASSWDSHARLWLRPLERVDRELAALADVLTAFADQDVSDFSTRSAALYRKRVGVSYLLPPGGGQLEAFYERVVRKLRERRAEEGLVDVNAPVAVLLRALLGEKAWPEAFRISLEQSPEHAVSTLREQVRIGIKKFLLEEPPGGQPILPRLQDLLAQACRHGPKAVGRVAVDQDYAREFAGELAGMLSANFSPQGSRPLKALISYPADARNSRIESYLMGAIELPAGQVTADCRFASADAITVVLYRTSMGITEVPEVRDTLRRWAGALASPEPRDLLRWRQRTGYNFDYLATREVDRVELLHWMLCALWNGKATVIGSAESPEQINIWLPGDVTMALPLTPLLNASSWGSLLRAYELWALDDDQLHREFRTKLVHGLPDGLTGNASPPAEVYQVLRKIMVQQVSLLDNMLGKQSADQQPRAAQMHGFWAVTLPAALDREFTGVQAPTARNLRELEMQTGVGHELM